MMFDTTAYGEFQSCSSLPLNQSQRDDDDEDDVEEIHEEDIGGEFRCKETFVFNF